MSMLPGRPSKELRSKSMKDEQLKEMTMEDIQSASPKRLRKLFDGALSRDVQSKSLWSPSVGLQGGGGGELTPEHLAEIQNKNAYKLQTLIKAANSRKKHIEKIEALNKLQETIRAMKSRNRYIQTVKDKGVGVSSGRGNSSRRSSSQPLSMGGQQSPAAGHLSGVPGMGLQGVGRRGSHEDLSSADSFRLSGPPSPLGSNASVGGVSVHAGGVGNDLLNSVRSSPREGSSLEWPITEGGAAGTTTGSPRSVVGGAGGLGPVQRRRGSHEPVVEWGSRKSDVLMRGAGGPSISKVPDYIPGLSPSQLRSSVVAGSVHSSHGGAGGGEMTGLSASQLRGSGFAGSVHSSHGGAGGGEMTVDSSGYPRVELGFPHRHGVNDRTVMVAVGEVGRTSEGLHLLWRKDDGLQTVKSNLSRMRLGGGFSGLPGSEDASAYDVYFGSGSGSVGNRHGAPTFHCILDQALTSGVDHTFDIAACVFRLCYAANVLGYETLCIPPLVHLPAGHVAREEAVGIE
eukprot:933562-Rhodomonas_salina.1